MGLSDKWFQDVVKFEYDKTIKCYPYSMFMFQDVVKFEYDKTILNLQTI